MKRQLLAIVAILMILSLSCSILQPKNQAPTDGGEATVESGTSGKDGSSGDGESPKETGDTGDTGSGGEEDSGFSIDADAFTQLDYYRSTVVTTYEKADGSTEESTIIASYIREPAAQSMVMETATGSTEVIQIGDQMWMKLGEDWMQTTADEGTDMAEGFGSLSFNPDDLQQYEQGDYKYIGTETIDGIKTRHYQNEEYLATWALALTGNADNSEIKKGILDVWVADESDLPKFTVKMVMVLEGNVDGADTKYTLSQVVTDINQPFSIDPPPMDEIGGLPEGVPLYPGAEEVTTFGGMTVFSSGDSIEDVAAFYNDALESAGWERTENTEIESMISSQWSKDGVNLTLNVSLGDGDAGSSVMIITAEE